jgi:hypothetical protein
MLKIRGEKRNLEAVLLALAVFLAGTGIPFVVFSSQEPAVIPSTGQVLTNEVIAVTGYWADIQAAVDSVVANGGVGSVHIPEGRWQFIRNGESMTAGAGKVRVPAGVDIFGAPTIRGTVNGISNFVVPDPNAPAGGPGSAKYGGWKTILYLPIDVGVSGGDTPPFFFMFTGSRTDWYDNSKPSRISDIFFEGYRFEHPSSTLEVSPLQMNGIADFRIDHCDFRSLGWGMWLWSHGVPSTSYGVVDHCNIINNVGVAGWDMGSSNVQYGILCGGTGYYTSGHYWITNPMDVLGRYTPLSVYIEDCQFSLWRHDIAANDDAHYVVRHCIFDNDTGYSTLDAHGARGSAGRYGTRAVEVYSCVFKNVGGEHYLGQLFAGAVAFHDNNVSSAYQTLYLGNDGSPYFDYAYLWGNRKTDASGNDMGPMTIIPNIRGGVEALIFLNTQLPGYAEYTYPHPLTSES